MYCYLLYIYLFIKTSFEMFLYLRWITSKAKKDGIDEEIAKYDGKL